MGLGLLLSAVALIWIILKPDWREIGRTFAQTNYWLVLAAVGLNLATIPMRTVRWQRLFPASHQPPLGQLTVALLVGQAINVLLPSRLGDVVRANLLEQERASFVLGTLVLQTVLDLLMLAALVVVLLSQIALPAWWRGSGEALLLTTAAVVLALLGLVAARRYVVVLLNGLAQRWPRFGLPKAASMAESFLTSFAILGQRRRMLAALLSSVLIWFTYGMVNYTLMLAVGVPASVLAAYFVLVVLQLGVAVPSSPGRIGVYHYLGVQALAVFGVAFAPAFSYAILLHLISVVLPVLLGGAMALFLRVPVTAAPPMSES